MVIPGYDDLSLLARNPVWALYRARRAGGSETVVVKVPVRTPPRASDLEDLEHEYELMRGPLAKGMPRAVELVQRKGHTFLVLEDRQFVTLQARLSAGRIDISTSLALAVHLAGTLAELHRHDIVHGSLYPAAILVSPDNSHVELADFSVAHRPPFDARAVASALLAVGASSYMAPEQTGRVNRTVDHRADLYQLGVTLYEMLTGRPPFDASDPLELIHCHIAKVPPPPTQLSPDIPEQLSRVVLRLLAKAAEDRYQTAAGVKHDLQICAREWASTRAIATFGLGERDVSDRLLIPQRLYGRDAELGLLTEAFDAAHGGHKTLLLVSGYSGVGKTSFISELCRPIARQHGYFIAGKFDQVARNVPYGALIQALRGLFWLLLAESDEQLTRRRAALLAALGANGGVIAEVIPEIELILGKQTPPPKLDPAEAQNRFRYVFENFVGTFAQPTHPLVIFLDDLQWADAATLDLLQALLTGPDKRHLLVIGAYRDNEVSTTHPLSRSIDRVESAGADVRKISLGSLPLPDLTAFLADTLRASAHEVETLAQLIQQKTDGNPFFVIQFLKALVQDGLISFDYQRGLWVHRTEHIAAAGITDNVAALMTTRIQRLSTRAQSVLRLAACIGSPFEWRTLLTASRAPSSEVYAGLSEALAAGLVEPATTPYELDQGKRDTASGRGAYGFIHDRVQHAAYALIPEDGREAAHLDVGRLLLAECGGDVPEDRLFALLNHLNLGRAHAFASETEVLLRLNLAAGRKAKTSAAYQAAWQYLQTAQSLLAPESIRDDYHLAFAVHLEAAEAQYLAGHFDEAQRSFETLLTWSRTPLDKASVYSLMVIANENMSRYGEAVKSGREGLSLLGISFPDTGADLSRATDREIAAIRERLGDRTIASLVSLPVMTDPEMRMVMRILTSVWAPAYITGNVLAARFISATMVRLSLTHGNTEDSAYGYVTHAVTIGPVMRDFRAAYDFGELALLVNERFADTKSRAKIHQQMHAHVKLWCRPFATCIPHAREAQKSGLETGDFAYAGYGAATESWPAFVVSRNLEQFVEEHTPALDLLDKIKMSAFRDALCLLLNWARALQGRTEGRCSLSDHQFVEADYHARYEKTAPLFLTFFYTAKLHLAVVMGDVALGVQSARRAREITMAGTIWPVLSEFWGAVALAIAHQAECPEAKEEDLAEIMRAEQSLRELGASCPENYRCFALLLSAELQRIDGHTQEAVRLYEEAMNYARLTDNLQQQALATERCAQMMLALNNAPLAEGLLREAYACYAAWGATAKLRQMEEAYGVKPVAAPESAHAVAPSYPPKDHEGAVLDVGSVIKVAQAIAGELERGALLRQLMRFALESAGAERGVFATEVSGHWESEAVAFVEGHEIKVEKPESGRPPDALFESVARYVRRTGRDVVLGDATADPRFADDAVRGASPARSVLCTSVSRPGKLRGVLFLENRLSETFTPDRIEIVRVIAAQAAIALESTRLYEEMKREVERRTQAERELTRALTELEAHKNRLEAENVYLQEEIETQHNFNEIIGRSPALVAALRKVELVAKTDATVLIVGETGAGKELFARAVHSRSKRYERALVKVNCGAIPPGLVESELFGHMKGAFTGAVEKRTGRFELAHAGTIFLDEVGELPLDAQVKLLRVLQEQEFEPVGSSRTVRVDVRVIAATNRNLEQAVKEGRFRADLLYRLNVFPIDVPPLRERKDDIPLLAGSFVDSLARRLGKPMGGFNPRSMEAMLNYSWPGNVRELANVVERAAILAEGPVLELDRALFASRSQAPPSVPPNERHSMDDIQRDHIQDVLKSTGGVVEGARGAAAILGMHPNTLRSRMKKLGIEPLSKSAARSS